MLVILENTAVKAARDIVYGVMRYASTRPEWKMEVITARQITIESCGIVERMSTSDISGSSYRIGLALEALRHQAFNGGLAVGNLAKIVGCSTRLLEKDFKKTTGRSIIDELNRIRLAKVQELLRNTSLDETAIATASGFGSCAYLRNLFRKRFGLTMRIWRQRHAKPSSR